jgi:signal peptidase I
MLVSWLKFLGVGLVVAIAIALCLRFFLDLDTRRVLGLSAIVAVVGTAVARAWLRPAPARTAKSTTEQHTQSTPREVVETVVFVVVLVLLLKSFAAEAFVIPTGSMAETLWGYQKVVTCPQCGQEFPVNCSAEVEEKAPPVEGCFCPNCRYLIDFGNHYGCNNGDRVLVAKFLYDLELPGGGIKTWDVVVFKFPERPQKDYVPMNYIKRLIGLPGQTIGIHHGNLYVAKKLEYKPDPDEEKLPLRHRTYANRYADLLQNYDPTKPSEFEILRKPPEKMLAMRRLVFDNDHQPLDMIKQGTWQPRWYDPRGDSAWAPDKKDEPRRFQHPAREAADFDWLRYRHLLRKDGGNSQPELITDTMGYNSGLTRADLLQQPLTPRSGSQNWVGDLMLECTVKVEKAEGELVLELSKGVDRFQARWQLPSGVCTLYRRGPDGKEDKLGEQPTDLKKPGEYRLRFANFDERLTVWVDHSLPFGDGVSYPPASEFKDGQWRVVYGPYNKNDLDPAGVGARGAALTVSGLKLWRDTYYTNPRGDANAAQTYYVQPGHYFCLGDNSAHSSDSRIWVDGNQPGLVPDRLMLGRALLVYWPFPPIGERRFGPIE